MDSDSSYAAALAAVLRKARAAAKQMNPYPNPAYVFYTDADDRIEGAKAYFCWELLHGADPEKLKQNPCWIYMEE